jgi:hypothetical protein
MRVLFLDVDGVLNGHDFIVEAQSCTIRRECVTHLNRVLKATDARLVLSSAWRYMVLGGAMTLDGFGYLLRTHGLIGPSGLIVGTTGFDAMPIDPRDRDERARQVSSWLAEHGPVDAYAVVDDDDFGWARHGHPHVLTDPGRGLTAADADRLIELLSPVGSNVQ